jgi:hypothetical protein
MDTTEFRLREELGAANARVEELQRKLAAAEDAGVLAQHVAAAAEREGDVADLLAFAGRFNGTSDGDRFAGVVLAQAVIALRADQAKRAGACGKPQECGGGCSLPVGHYVPCRCSLDGDCPA